MNSSTLILENKILKIKNIPKPIAIIGMGITGESVLELLTSCGISKDDIFTFDKKREAHFSHSDELIQKGKPKTLIVSPGVPLSSLWIQEFKSKGGIILSELSLANSLLSTEKIIAVTGSLGKSTTVSLLEAGLKKSQKLSSFVGGNLGVPLAVYANQRVLGTQASAVDWVVLELSSYQLENFSDLKADFSALTYLTPNHLERYLDLEAYYKSKWILTSLTQGQIVLNQKGGDLFKWALQNIDTKQSSRYIWTHSGSEIISKYSLQNRKLIGSHNLDNMAVAAQLAELAAFDSVCFEGMKQFAGLPHRSENLGLVDGIRYINDSKATTMESVKTAVQSTLEDVSAQNFCHLLLGGKDKNLPWNELFELKKEPRLKFYFFGQCRDVAKSLSQLDGPQFEKMTDAINYCQNQAHNGDTILLSPGGTSLDEFKNFEDRGEVFQKLSGIE
jgi:UDP-N-acetylmuramoylalanine--D-glutamate ligase